MTDEKDMEVSQESAASTDESASEEQAPEQSPDETPPEDASEETPSADPKESGEDHKVVNEGDASEEDAEAAMLDMLEELPDEESAKSPDDINFDSDSVSRAEFQQLQQASGAADPRNIDLLMDVDLPVSIELGRTRMPISDILSLGPGSVVELNKLAGEPVDLLINYKVVARGEVVVVDENFGLRITQLMTPDERLKALADE